MTRDEVLAMEAGRKLDRLIAQHIMGKVCHDRVCINGEWFEVETWLEAGEDPADPWIGTMAGGGLGWYSTDIAAAWEVVEHLVRQGMWWAAEFYRHDDPPHDWAFCKPVDNRGAFRYYDARADSLPLAICRAALLAAMEAE